MTTLPERIAALVRRINRQDERIERLERMLEEYEQQNGRTHAAISTFAANVTDFLTTLYGEGTPFVPGEPPIEMLNPGESDPRD